MKKINLLFLFFICLLSAGQMNAQCVNTSQFGGVTASEFSGPVVIATNQWATEFNVNTVQVGETYEFTSSVATDHISLTDENNVSIAFGTTPVSGVATSTTMRAHINTDAACGTEQVSRTITIECTSCPAPPIPANDLCADAIDLGQGAGTEAGTTDFASETGEPADGCGTPVTTEGVWYTFTAQANGDAMLELCGAPFDSKMSVYTGTCGALVCVDGEDDDCGNDPSLNFAVTEGTLYTVYVHGFGGQTGTFDLAFALPTCALTCPAAISVSSDAGVCGADLTIANPADLCAAGNPITNDFNGTTDASGLYPVGTTTVTFTGTDADGLTVSCSTTVTVTDDEDPTIACPADIFVSLASGECDAVVSYAVGATDNCSLVGTGPATASPAVPFTGGNGFAANAFNITNAGADPIVITGEFDLNLSGNADIEVYYTNGNTVSGVDSDASAFTLLGTAAGVVSAGAGQPTNVTVAGGTPLTLAPGETKGLYVQASANVLDYTNGTGTYGDGTLVIDMSTNDIAVGGANNFFSGGRFSPRQFNGNVYYASMVEAQAALTAGLASGENFPIGTTTNTYSITDLAGNTSTCSFDVVVTEFVSTSNDISCIGSINVTLDENCQAIVGADELLTGTNYGCFDNYDAVFDDGPRAGLPVLLGPGDVGVTYKVRVTNPAGVACWGFVTAEDKTDPIIICRDVNITCADPLPTSPYPAGLAAFEGGAGLLIDAAAANTVDFPIEVALGGQPITDLNVVIDIEHTFVSDLTITATSPQGTRVTLWGGFCGGNDNLLFTADDQGRETTACVDYNSSGDNIFAAGLIPTPALGALNGENPDGTWMISVADGFGLDGGVINRFALEFTANAITAASDACGPVTTTFEDVTSGDLCTGQTIVRTWTVEDGSGNTASCVQNINITPTTVADVIAGLPADITVECGDVIPDPINTLGGCGNIGIGLIGTPTMIPTCGNGFKMVRRYEVIDWCVTPAVITEHVQLIKVEDTVAPSLTCPADLTVGTSSNDCSGNVALPTPSATDACSDNITIIPTATVGTIVYSPITDIYTLTNAPVGTHTITLTATDDCGNASTCTYNVTIEDNIAPIAICDEHTIVGIGSDGQALIPATTFDDGSTDNCGIVTMTARRMDNPNCPGFDGTAFAAFVPFTCCDLGSTVMVEFRVTDEEGNANSCMVEVDVQDKIRPIIICPVNKTIECTDDISPAFTGEAVATDNCGTPVVTFVDISNTIDDCGVGTIRRSWTARVDNTIYGSANCIQTITVINSDPFVITDTECRRFPLNTPQHTLADDVEWPCDIELNTCGIGITPDALADNGTINPITNQQVRLDARPTVTENACENVAMTYIDTQLDFGAGDACIKVLRKWIIINWCDVANNQDPTVPGPGVYHYVQVIKVLNSTAPVIETFNGATTIDNFSGSTQTNNPNDACGTAFVAFDITASDDCSAASDLVYTWAFSTGTSGTGTSASGAFANGDYSVTFSVSDQCGNTSTETRDFTVRDAKKPTPVCIFGIASTIMPSAGQVTIWASDFESGSSFDNCTPYGQLEFSFSQDITDKSIVIECDDIPTDGLYPITLYVTDGAGNFDFCSTFINVQDPNGACGIPTALINGEIKNEFDETIQDVTVTLSDDAGMNVPVTTGVDGSFQFASTYGEYDVTPEKDINYLNGVTTFDLVLISKHILGTETLSSPYQVIAADANNSQSVTTLDIVKLRALILHIDDELANNDSWRFVDANHTFTSNNPLTENFNEYVALDGTTFDAVNFTAVKVGDVNGTATPNNLLGSVVRTFNGDLALQVATTEVAAGETFTVDFTAKDFNNIDGYQFSLGFNNAAVEFVDVVTSLEGLTAANFGLAKLNEGVITTSWNTAKAVSMEDDATLFSLTFVANEAVNTSELFEINSRYTASEAYDGADLYNVKLAFNGTTASDKFELYQNTPNPFKAETTIGFNLTEAGNVTLKLYDVSGRVLRLIEMDAVKGFNSVNVSRDGMDATGVLYYQLETATETATKKMILVD